MNMISTGAFQDEMDASKKTKTLVSELVSVWEKKNAKLARAGGVSLMALSLAACGSSDDTATTTTTTTTTTVAPVASTTVKLANDGGSFSLSTTVAGVSVPSSSAAKIYINDNEPGDAYSFTLDASAAGSGTLTMEFADAGDTVTLAADSSFGNFTTIEIKNGTIDISAVTTASNVTSVSINSGLKATADQLKTLTSITGTGEVTAVVSTQADIDSLIAHFNTISSTVSCTLSAASGSTLTAADITAGNTNVKVETDGNSAAATATDAAKTITLTTTGDSVTGGAGDDQINGVVVAEGGVGSTMQPGDFVDGGAGSDTLTISATGDVNGYTLAAVRTANVEKVLISNFDTDTTKSLSVDASLFDGVTTVGLSASGVNGDTIFTNMLSMMDAEMNGGADLTMTYHASTVTGTADVQNLLVQNTTGAFTANSVETINITSSLLNNTLASITADAATKITIAGDKNLTITNELSGTVANIATIDASALTGNLTIRNNDTTTNATLGSGDDVYRANAAVAATFQVDGGAGEDEISVDAGTVLDTALETARYVNFEAVQLNNIGAASANMNQDMALLSGIDTMTVVAQDSTDGNANATNNSTFTNVVDGSTIKLETLSTAENGHTFTVGVTAQSAADNTTNTLNLVMGSATAASGATVTSATNAAVFATLTANNAETLTITSQGGANTLGTITSADMTTLNILGDQTLTLGNIGSATKLATVDASGMTSTAALVMSGTNASTTAGTYTGTANADTLVGGTKADTLNGGAGIDNLTGGAGANVLNGEAGNDVLTGSATADETLNGGAGNDDIRFATANFTNKDTVSGGDGTDEITITNAATVVDADFTNVTSIETLTLEAAGTDVDLGVLADAAGVRTVVSTAGANNDDINMVKDFASDITIQIGQGNDTITAAATYAGAMTVDLSTLGDADDLDGSDTITGGAGSDTLLVKATGTAITAVELAAVSKIETIKISNDATTNTITLADANIAAGATLTVDGTAIISDSKVLTVVGTNETNGTMKVLGGAGADVITGTASTVGDDLQGNGGGDTFNFATANLTKLDTVDGGAGTDTIATSDGGTLVDADFTGVSNVENVSLGAGTTVTLDTIADGAGFTKFTHSSGTNSVTLKAGYDNAYEVNLVASTKDTVDGTLYTGDMTVKFANMDHIDAGAVLTGGTGTNDTLSIDATNTALTANELANITKIENFVLLNDEATAAITLNNANAGAGESIKVDASALITTNAASISAANEADGLVTIIGGNAGDTITLSASGAGGDTITAGNGDDTINVATANYTALDIIDGGAGTADNLTLSTGGTLSDASFGGTTNVEKLTTANADTTIIMGANAKSAGIKTVSLVTGSNTNSVTLGALFTNDVTVALTDNTDTVQGVSYTGKATITVAEDNFTAADTITGGTGTDTMTVTFDDNNADALTAAEMANVTKVDVIKAATNAVGSLALADANVAKGASIEVDVTANTADAFVFDASAELDGSVVYKGGAGADTITGSAGADTITAGAGDDTITGGKGADTISGGTGTDTFTYTAANQSTTNSTDTISDFTTGTDKFAVTLDFSSQVNALTVDATVNTAAAGTSAVAAGLSAAIGQATYDTTNSQLVINANADNLITTSDYVINVNAAATAANSIVEGDINYTITTGSAGDTITAGGGADTITAGGGNDTVTAGKGADTIAVGTGVDTVVFTEILDGLSALVTITHATSTADDFTATAGTTVDSVTSDWAVASDFIKIDGNLEAEIVGSIGTAADVAIANNGANLNFAANGIAILTGASATLAADNFGDVSDVIAKFNGSNGTPSNAAANDEILFTLEGNSANLTGLYFLRDVGGNGDIDVGDQIALLAIIADDTLTATEVIT